MDCNVRFPELAVKSTSGEVRSPRRALRAHAVSIALMPRQPTRKTKPGASAFAKKRAAQIREARENREPDSWSQSKLAEAVEVTRETVYQWEAAGVEEIEFVTCVRVAAALGLELSDLLTEAQRRDMQNFEPLPGISPQARRIARAWDSLPPALRNWIWSAVESYQQLSEKHPVIAQAIHNQQAMETGQFPAIKDKNRK